MVLGFRVGVGDALAAAHGFQRFQHRFARDPVSGEQALRRLAALLRQRQQQVLGGDVVVLELVGLFETQAQGFLQAGAHVGLRRPFHPGKLGQFSIYF